MTRFHVEPLSASHRRDRFDCGVPALNRYFQTQVGQDARRNIARCFVLVDNDADAVAGYYTLAMGALPLDHLPPALAAKFPRYPQVSAARIGRLAVDLRYRGQGLGEGLIASAIHRVRTAEVAAYALIVDAKDDDTAAFYRRYAFLDLQATERTLFLVLPAGQR